MNEWGETMKPLHIRKPFEFQQTSRTGHRVTVSNFGKEGQKQGADIPLVTACCRRKDRPRKIKLRWLENVTGGYGHPSEQSE